MMIDREIRAMIRGANAIGYLTGWYWCDEWTGEAMERRYLIVPAATRRPRNLSRDETVEYCEALRAAGVKPVYHGALKGGRGEDG